MKRELDLISWLVILTIIGVVVLAVSFIDFSSAASIKDFEIMIEEPLELKNWHYILLIFVIYLSRSK